MTEQLQSAKVKEQVSTYLYFSDTMYPPHEKLDMLPVLL